MIPSIEDDMLEELEEETEPSLNYKMHFEKQRIIGICDELEAMRQVVFKILNTERYEYPIYSWDYGVELKELFDEPIPYVVPEIERRITEALEADDRIDSVDNFEFRIERRTVYVSFAVHTIFGDLEDEGLEVSV